MQVDKAKHLGVSVGVSFVAFFFFSTLLRVSPVMSIFLSIAVGFLVGWGYEKWQKNTGKGFYDGWDAFADAIGSLLGAGLGYLVFVELDVPKLLLSFV